MCKPGRRLQRERGETKYLTSITIALFVGFEILYVSQLYSAKYQREIVEYRIIRELEPRQQIV